MEKEIPRNLNKPEEIILKIQMENEDLISIEPDLITQDQNEGPQETVVFEKDPLVKK